MRIILSVKLSNPQHREKLIHAKFNSYKISGENPKPLLHRVISLSRIQVLTINTESGKSF